MKITKKEEILIILKVEGAMKVSSLEKQAKIPRTTLLRYLKELEEKGQIIKIFGEVKIRKSNLESSALPRINAHKIAKRELSTKAFLKIKNGDVIYIDGGSTTYYLFDKLKNTKITIYTNNLLARDFIDNLFVPIIHFIPGEINKTTLAIASSESVLFIKNIYFDKSFVGFNSFLQGKYSTTNEKEASLKRIVIKQTTGKVYAMGRKNKTSSSANYIFANKTEMVEL